MDTLIKMAAWLTSHSLHQHDEPAAPAESTRLSRGWFEPLELLGLDGLSFRAAWDALP